MLLFSLFQYNTFSVFFEKNLWKNKKNKVILLLKNEKISGFLKNHRQEYF